MTDCAFWKIAENFAALRLDAVVYLHYKASVVGSIKCSFGLFGETINWANNIAVSATWKRQLAHHWTFQPWIIPNCRYEVPPPPHTHTQNRVLEGISCFQHVRNSILPSFRQHLRFLLYNFDSFCLILFKFTPHLNHQTMHVWGWGISIIRVMPLCNSFNKMLVGWLVGCVEA